MAAQHPQRQPARRRRHHEALPPLQRDGAGGCDGEVNLKLDSDGKLVCTDACGNEVDLGKCAKLKLDGDGNARLQFSRRCKLEPAFKERLEAVAANGATVYERIDDE